MFSSKSFVQICLLESFASMFYEGKDFLIRWLWRAENLEPARRFASVLYFVPLHAFPSSFSLWRREISPINVQEYFKTQKTFSLSRETRVQRRITSYISQVMLSHLHMEGGQFPFQMPWHAVWYFRHWVPTWRHPMFHVFGFSFVGSPI